VVFLIAVPLLAPVLATGLPQQERLGLTSLAWYFLPWTLVCLPYYAAAARQKMEWRFNRVFAAEIVIVVISISFLALWHDDVRMLPLAYACGYIAGLAQLSPGSGLWRLRNDGPAPSVRAVLRNIAEMFAANQTGNLTTLVHRHIQSFVGATGIAAINYSAQVTTSLANLLTFREIYMVPLAQQEHRAERLERLVTGLCLMAVPVAGLVACFAPELVTVLLQRGRFDASASLLTAQALRIEAFSLIFAPATPLFRMFQITDRINFTHVTYIASALSLVAFGYLFVLALGWGVRGAALMQVAAGAVGAVLTGHLISRCGIRLRWRVVFARFLLAALVSGIAFLIATAASMQLENVWGRLIVGTGTYGLVVLSCYFFARAHLRDVMLGFASARPRF
jgi:peptidoglycan biosynthesis protein MviN/MurJ (putative lipid II flippase)